MHSLVIHGGAGFIPAEVPESQRELYKAGLARASDEGFAVLERGGASLDAVTVAVRILEDDPLFNSAHGAALTREGAAELDASIMDGRDQRAGAVAGVTRVKNPVDLARAVMEQSRHVMMIGSGAEEFALEIGMPLVSNHYFRVEVRRQQLEAEQSGRKVSDLVPAPQGTVGCVAFDRHGNLAAATSTGGMTNKRPGRVGDTPIVGAGTFARNGVAGISCTGHGEYFIRTVAAHHIVTAVEYRGLALDQAMREVLDKVAQLGGDGGIIGIDAQGHIAMEFNTPGMFRGARDSQGRREVALFR